MNDTPPEAASPTHTHLRVIEFQDWPMSRKSGRVAPDEDATPLWSIACVDHLIVASGATIEEARTNFGQALRTAMRLSGDDLTQVGPAPKDILERWEAARLRHDPSFSVTMTVLHEPSDLAGDRELFNKELARMVYTSSRPPDRS